MISSYQFSHENNFQSILWDAIGAAAAIVRRSIGGCAALWAVWLPALWLHALPDLAMLCAGLLRAVGWSLAIVAIVGALALVLANPVIIGCVGIIVAFAWVTYPRSAKPARCPYCKGKNISGGMGHWECNDCGREGSY